MAQEKIEQDEIEIHLSNSAESSTSLHPLFDDIYETLSLSIRIHQGFCEECFNCFLLGAVLFLDFYFFRREIAKGDIQFFEHLLSIIPVLLLSLPLLLLTTCYVKRELAAFELSFIKPGIELPISPLQESILTPKNHLAVRLLHPKYAYIKKEGTEKLDWLNEDEQKGLKINILRTVLLARLSDANFLTKFELGFHIHRIQVLIYAILLFATIVFVYLADYQLATNYPSLKVMLRIIGVGWWLFTIKYYKSQIERLQQWLEKTRGHSLSIHLPLFIWEPSQRYWHELSFDELHRAFLGNYGVEAEKAVTLTQSIFLTIYIISLGML